MVDYDDDGDVSEKEGHHYENGLFIKVVVDESSREVCNSRNHPCPNEEKHIVVGIRHYYVLCSLPFEVVAEHENHGESEDETEEVKE